MSVKDLQDVIRRLGPSQLQHLYIALELNHNDVQKQEVRANTHDIDLKAIAVLRFWQDQNGEDATKERILEALEYMGVKAELENIWNIHV